VGLYPKDDKNHTARRRNSQGDGRIQGGCVRLESARICDGALEREGDRERVNLEVVLEIKLDIECASRCDREMLGVATVVMGGASHKEMTVALSFSSLTIRHSSMRPHKPVRLTFLLFDSRRPETDRDKHDIWSHRPGNDRPPARSKKIWRKPSLDEHR